VNRRYVRDPGLVFVVALALVAAAPFLTRPGLPRGTDAELHVFRAAEVSACWRAGVIYPRWAPDFYYGYGYPIFNYYAPLTYHLSSLFALLPGIDIVTGVKAVFVLGLILGGVGTYLLVRDLFGPTGATVGASAFLLAPYTVFVNPHVRGDLAEHFAVGLLPLAFFFLRRLVARGGRATLVGATTSIAAIVLSHNLIGVTGLVLLLAGFLWQVTVEGGRDGVGRGVVAFMLAAAVSAFFWLPLLAELEAVKLAVVGPGHFDFRNHFVPVRELLARSRLVDLGAVAPRSRFNLGLVQWGLALVGAGTLAHRATSHRRALLFFSLVSIGLVFLMTSASLFLWEILSPLAYLQFPWRLLGPAALTLAVMAGGGTTLLPSASWRPAALAGVVLLVLLAALPTMFPHPWAGDFGDTSPAGIVEFELEGRAVGTTSTGDFLPTGVATLLHPEQALVDSYDGPGPVDKVNRTTLPEGTTVEVVEHAPDRDRFYISGDHSFVLRLYTLLFPGWHAYVDGQEVEIEPGLPETFITFGVPRGEHEVLVRFEDTPARRAGWGIAAGGMLGLVAALGILRTSPEWTPQGRLATRVSGYLCGVLACFVLFKVVLVNPHETWFRYTSPAGEAWAAQHQQRAVLGEQVELLGFDLPRRRVRSGGELTLVLYWRALEPLSTNYQSFVHVTHPSSISWGQSDSINPGGLPTTHWPTDQYVWDAHRVEVLPGTPPGEYRLEVGLYTMADGRRLPVLSDDGVAVGQTAVLEVPVEVLPARRPPAVGDLELDEAVGATYEGQVELLGYTTSEDGVGAPGFLHLTLFWRAKRGHLDELMVTVAVLDEAGEPVAIASGPPAVGRYPTTRWSRGEVVRDPYAFWLDEEFLPGTYSVGVVIHRGDQPITAQGLDEPFLRLFSVEVHGWEG
jgi:hypothetical protein